MRDALGLATAQDIHREPCASHRPQLFCPNIEALAVSPGVAMRKLLFLLLVVVAAGNGVLMLLMPEYWYQLIPGVAQTGPFNAHFVRDIGCAYLVCGGSFAWLLREARAWPAAAAASAFLVLHALTHVWDSLAGREDLPRLLGDVPGVFVVPALALWLLYTQPRTGSE